MRKFIQSSVVILTLAIAGAAAGHAQAGQRQRHSGQSQGRKANPESEVKMLTKRLNLSAEQAAQIEPILADRQARMHALKPAEGSQPDFKALRQQHKAIMQDTHAKLNAILTPEQQQELEKLREHRGERGPRGPRGDRKPQGESVPSA